MNIKTFDVQHGIITDVNYYNLSKRHSFNQLGWPDYILCWDKESELRLKRLTDNKVNLKLLDIHPITLGMDISKGKIFNVKIILKIYRLRRKFWFL